MKSRGVKSLIVLLTLLSLGQIVWWGYAIIDKQNQIAQLKDTSQAKSEAQRTKIMIFSEGVVFLCVWLMIFYIAYRFYKKENELQIAQRDFLAAITHELKTPLTNIQLSLDTLERPDIDDEMKVKYIDRAQIATGTLLNQVEQILHLADSEKSHFQKSEVNIANLVNECIHFVVPDADQTHVKSELQNITVMTSEEQTKLVVQALIDNALKYSKQAMIDKATAPQIKIYTVTAEESLVLYIEDNGIGFEQQDLENMLSPFWRSQHVKEKAIAGTGVGLSLAKKLSARLGIRFELYSDGLYKGCQAKLIFPLGKTNHG